jgi:peptidoglycan-associated lipoprotein
MIKTFTSLAIAAVLVGCAGGTQTTTDRKSVTHYSGMTIAKPAPVAAPVDQVRSVVISGHEQGARVGTVYFDFDQYIVKAEYLNLLEKLAGELKNDPGRNLSLEGHTDEYGSREYNVALGQRRSEAVRQVLLRFGVSPSQLEAVSYGEERLAVEGNTIAGNSKNRRAELREAR